MRNVQPCQEAILMDGWILPPNLTIEDSEWQMLSQRSSVGTQSMKNDFVPPQLPVPIALVTKHCKMNLLLSNLTMFNKHYFIFFSLFIQFTSCPSLLKERLRNDKYSYYEFFVSLCETKLRCLAVHDTIAIS